MKELLQHKRLIIFLVIISVISLVTIYYIDQNWYADANTQIESLTQSSEELVSKFEFLSAVIEKLQDVVTSASIKA